ncbi:MAG: sensor domain-containing diguanylate cyclase [Planctomycetes bacterium]|nr:sensor domain-containing diguanylate cyclase [Planctomycetota bacterium]
MAPQRDEPGTGRETRKRVREKALNTLREILKSTDGGHEVLTWVEENERLSATLELMIRKQELDFTTILEIANQINARSIDSRGVDSYISYVASVTRGQFGVSKVYIVRSIDFATPRFVLIAQRGAEQPLLEFEGEGPFARRLKQASKPILVSEAEPDLAAMPELQLLKGLEVEVLVPLLRVDPRIGPDLKGVLCLGRRILRNSYSPQELKFLWLLGDMIAISLHNAQLHHRSIVDGLTQVYSRGHFDLQLQSELARAERYGRHEGGEVRSVSLIMLDIDHFKKCNDTYGHQVGDAVLRSVAQALQGAVRKSDEVARYGGEEFALIAPETTKNECVGLAERLRKKIEASVVKTAAGGEVKVTASLGVACFPQDARDGRELVAKADRALYLSKEHGRNCVTAADVDDRRGRS